MDPRNCFVFIFATAAGLAAIEPQPARAVPLPFEAHDGGSYRTRHLTCALELTATGAAWRDAEGRVVSLALEGATGDVALVAEDAVPIRRYIGVDPAGWSLDHGYSRLVWRDPWPGIDMWLTSDARGYKRDVFVSPGADPSLIRMRVTGAAVRVDEQGRLVLDHPGCPIVESAPVAWQDAPTGRDLVPVAWAVADDGAVTFDLGAWDPSRALVIDPVIPSGGLFGATLHEDTGYDVVIAPTGETYVVGGAQQDPNVRGSLTRDAFVLALDEDLSLLWLTWFGGTKDNLLAPTCAAYATPNEPNSACITWQSHPSGLGGNDDAIAVAIADDRLAVVGHTYATDLPTLDPFIAAAPLGPAPTYKGRRDGFVLILNRATGASVMSSYLGGDDDDLVSAVQVLDHETIAVVGGTRSPDWGSPTYQPPFIPNLQHHYAYAFTLKKVTTPDERWQPAPHFAPSPLVGVQPYGRATFNALHMVAGEPWFLGEHEGTPLRWRPPGRNRPAPTTDYLATSGGAAIVQAFTLPLFEAGVPRTMLVGNVAGTLGGFDGAGCDWSRSSCGTGLPCGMTDAFVAFLYGDHCSEVIYLGGSLGDVLFGSAHARYAPDRDFLVLAGRTASTDLRARAAIQRQAGQPAGNGVDAFYAVVDVPNVAVKILSYLGGAPDLTRSYLSSDDVATGVALGPNREATLVGMTRTSFADFGKEISVHVPAHEAEAGQAFVARMPVEVADLGTTITVDRPVLAQNATTEVVVKVKNEGTIAAQGVTLLVELDPDGLTVAPSPPPTTGCTQNASPLSWTCRPPSGLIAEGAEQSFTFVLKAPAANGVFLFLAKVNATSHDPNLDNNDAVGEIRVGGIDFRPTITPKEPTPSPAVVGAHESALVELLVNNRAGELARARVQVTASHPLVVAVGPDVTGCSATACDEGKTCLPLTCDGPLQNNETSPLDWFAKTLSLALLDPFATPGPETTVVVTAKTSPLDGKTDSFTGNDTMTLPIIFRQPDIVAVSAVITPKVVPWSGAAMLSLVARDDGPGHTSSVEVSFDPSPFSPGTLPARCVFDAGRIQCAQDRPELGAIPVGQVYVMDIPLVAPAKDDSQVAREVTLSPKWRGTGADPKPANNIVQAKAWLGAVDVRVEPPDPASVYPTHSRKDLTWVVKNHASDPASNVSAAILLGPAAGVEVDSAKIRGTDCTKAKTGEGAYVVCSVGNLGAQESVSIELGVRALVRGDILHSIEVQSQEENAAKALYPLKHSLVAKGPDLVSDLSIVDLELPPGVVRGVQRSLVFSAVNRGPGASPPGGSPTVIDMSLGSTGLTSSNAALGCTWAPLVLADRYGTRITCKPQFDGSADQRLETTFTITPNYRGINEVLANATDPNEEKPSDNVKSLVFEVEGAKLKPTLSGPAKVEVDVPFALDLKIVNDGWADAKPVEAVLVFPAERLELVGSPPAGCQSTPGRVECRPDLPEFEQATYPLQLRGKKTGTARITGIVLQPSDPLERQITLTADVEVVGPDIAVTHVESRPSAWLTPPQVGEVDFRVKNQSATTAITAARVVARVASSTGGQGCSRPHDPVSSAVHSGACTAGNVSAAGAEYACDLAPGAEAILRFSATAVCPGQTVLEVNANIGAPELDTTNNRATATVLSREPKLGLKIETDMGAQPIEGPYDEPLIGNVIARDLSGYGVGAGPDPDDRIRVELSVPSPFTLDALTTSGGTCSLGSGTTSPHCLLTSIGPNAAVPIAFAVHSTHGPARRPIRATATGLVLEAVSASTDLVAKGPDLALSVVSAPSGKIVGERGEWVLKVENVGPAGADHAAISFTEPSALIDLITVDGVNACSASATGRVCTLPGGSIAAGASAQVTFGARLKKAGDVSIPARATSRYQPDANGANDAVALTTQVLGPDLAVTLALSPDTALVGNAVDLQLSVQNVGSVASDATTALIQLGALVSVSSLAPGCTLQQGVAHCNLPALTPGQTEILSSRIAGTRAGAITLLAQAMLGDDADPSNDKDTALLTITSADADKDGTPDSAEDQGPNGGDANRDGKQDSTQPHVTTIVIPKYGPFIAESSAGTTLIITPSNNPSSPPVGTKAPLAPVGTFSFKIYGVTPGARATVKFTFPAGVPAQSWWKYNDTTQQWSEFTWDAVTLTGAKVISARVLEVTVQDDGRGDEDPTDGVIKDPGTPLLPVITVDDAGDADDASPGNGTCATAGGTCTLRAAISEINASLVPRYVVFDFATPTTIKPATPLPTLTTPAVIDGSDVPGPNAFEPGLTLSGVDLGAGRLIELGVAACGLVRVKLADVGGHGLVITQPAARVADSWLGRPLYGTGLTPTEQASVWADNATDLMIADSWVGRINGTARYGLDLSGEDIRLDGVRINVDPREGRRLFGDVSTGVRLRDTVRARIDRLVVNGTNIGVHASGDGTGAVLRGSFFGLGANGLCNAFTNCRPFESPEDCPGPCQERNLQGLVLDGAHGWTIGGLDASERNAFGDHTDAILVTSGSYGNHFYNNLIGLAADGTCQPDLDSGTAFEGLCRLFNVRGLAIVDGQDNVIGAPGAGNVFGVGTLELSGADTNSTLVKSNFIGLYADLLTPVRPSSTAQTAFQVGGGATGTTIDDNTMSGLYVVGAGTNDTVITNNRIGLLPSGLALPGPGTEFDTWWSIWPSGVLIQDGPSGVTIAGNTIANTVFDNLSNATGGCVRIETLYGPAVTNVAASDNLLGLTADGRKATACEGGAFVVQKVDGVILDGNVVGHCGSTFHAGFKVGCVRLGRGARATEVRDNVFGLLRDGRDGPWGAVTPLMNPIVIVEEAPASLIADNFMLGAAPYAIYDRGSFFGSPTVATDGARLLGNRIGVDPGGAPRGAPTFDGILAVGNHARIGGVAAGEGNTIVGAGRAGIRVGAVSGVAIRGNVLDDNAELGISLGGTIPIGNDTLDADGGPNGSQNHPVVGAFDEGSTSVAITLGSAGSTTYTIDVYGVMDPDPSGHGEADVFLGTTELTTDGSGQAQVSVTLSRAPNPGEYLTAIATGPDGSSEFGPAVIPDVDGVADLALYLSADNPAVGEPSCVRPLVENLNGAARTEAKDVFVDIELPSGLMPTGDFEYCTRSPDCSPTSKGVRCYLASIPLGGAHEIFLPVSAASAGRYPVTARVRSGASDPVLDNNVASTDVDVGTVGFLLVGNLKDYRQDYAAGERVPIETNIYRQFGTITGLEISLRQYPNYTDLPLPPGTSADITLPAALGGGTFPCTVSEGTARCETGATPITSTQLVTVGLTFTQAGNYTIRVSGEADGPNSSGLAAFDVYPKITAPPPALSITLDGPTDPLPTGTLETWTATLSNSGATPLTDVALVITPPAGMVFRGADAPCAPLGDEVICLPAAVPETGSLVIALAFDSPPADGTLTTCARRVSGDTLLEEHCDDLAVVVAPFDRALSVSPSVVSTATDTPAALTFTVSSSTGAPAGTLVLTPSTPPSAVYAPACTPVDDTWQCAFGALAVGGTSPFTIEVLHDAGVVTWSADIEGSDATADNDHAQAAVLVTTSDLCGAWVDTTAFVDTLDAPLTADGFVRVTPTDTEPLSWVLADGTGTLTTPSLTLPATTHALHVTWLDRRLFGEGTDATIAISTDAGQSWTTLATAMPTANAGPHALALTRADLGLADEPVDLLVRWHITGVEPGTWALDGIAVTTCQPDDAQAAVTVSAAPAFVAADLDALATTTFSVHNASADTLSDMTLSIALDAPDALFDADVAGGACVFDALGAACALPPIAADATVDVIVSGLSNTDRRVALDAVLTAPLTLTGTTAASASWRFGAPADEGAALTWQPSTVTVAPSATESAALEVAGEGGDVFPGGPITLSPAPGITLTPTSDDCVIAGEVLTCDVPLLAPGETHTLPVSVTPVGSDRTDLVIATWSTPSGSASADLNVAVDSGGALSLAFPTPDPLPAALEPALVTLEVTAAGGVTAGTRVAITASAGLTLQSLTGPGASCGFTEAEAFCDLPAIGDAETLTLTIGVLTADAGLHSLFAALTRGTAGADPTATLLWAATRDCATYPCATDPCLDTTCDADLGCLTTTREGLACDPALTCERDGVCVEGACLAAGGVCPPEDVCEAWLLDCDDEDDCTADSCEPYVGCVNEPAGECCDASDCADDGDPCTTATCDAGLCGDADAADGTPCDADANACTDDDSCQSGTCTAGAALDCDDGDACTTDSCNPATGCVNTAIAGCCDSAADCPATGNACTTATCNGNVCGTTPVSNGTPCDADGSQCTDQDSCQSGTCTAGAPLQCAPDTTCTTTTCQPTQGCVVTPVPGCCTSNADCPGVAPRCQSIYCDVATGQCLTTPLANGTPCDADGSVCTENDSCQSGACTAGAAKVCDDARVCTTDSCDARLGCRFTVKSGCCESDAACAADTNPCTNAKCDTATGQCSQTAVQDGTTCDADRSVCTTTDSCRAGTCTAGAALDCDDGDPCTTDSCDARDGCRHVDIVNCCLADAECADDPDPCKVGACNEELQRCAVVAVEDGTPCDADASVCTDGDACLQGTCAAGAPLDCDDGDPCTIDACDPATGCTHVASTEPACVCAPSRASTECLGGDVVWRDGCDEVGAVAVACDDGDVATDDRCEAEAAVCLRVPAGRDDCDTSCTGAWTSACEDGHVVWRDPCGLTAGVAVACASDDHCTAARCDEELAACVRAPADDPRCAPDEGCDATRALACEGDQLVWRDGCGETIGVAMDCHDGDPRTADRCDEELLGCVSTPASDALPSRLCETGPGDAEAAEVVEELIADTTADSDDGSDVTEPSEPETIDPPDTVEASDTSDATDVTVIEDTRPADTTTPPEPDPSPEATTERTTSGKSDGGCGCSGARDGAANLVWLGWVLAALVTRRAHLRRRGGQA